MSDPTIPPLPSPWDYCYVWRNTYFGEHRSFSTAHYNGAPCDDQVLIFSADQLRAFYLQGYAAGMEAAAKICEEYETANDIAATWQNIIAAAIRKA